MIARKVYLFFAASLLLWGCTLNDEYTPLKNDQNEPLLPCTSVSAPSLEVELTDDAIAGLEAGTLQIPDGYTLSRVFPEDPEFEERHRAFGLHRWYFVSTDGTAPATKASEALQAIPGVLRTEPYIQPEADAISFNDPYAYRQWHLFNDGSLNSKFVSGIDLNVEPVWSEFTGGSNDVIVGVVDTGAEANHPDLQGVVIPAGANGSKSFLGSTSSDPYNITPQRHGTHVAGIIAAINNNGKGVCGIAGGKNGYGGVRILDCQGIAAVEGDSGNPYNAIVWAADHGAVILNNSWNAKYDSESAIPTTTPYTYRLAIDYFVQKAGTDGSGKQTGPMKGGAVFFSAGNNGWSKSQPSMYEKNFSVGALGPAGEATNYTNYGDWVDLCAPGGNGGGTYGSTDIPQIYSTMAGSGYYQMQGTSQAAPCASGVAALIVSYFGGDGFTPDRLREIMINGANTDVPLSHGKNIGPMVDAYGSFLYASGAPMPGPVTDIAAIQTPENNIEVSWTMPRYGKQNVYKNLFLMSKNASLLEDPDPFNLPSGVTVRTIPGRSKTPGAKVSEVIQNPVFDTDYYFTIVSYTARRYVTTGNTVCHIRPRKNSAPVLTSDYYMMASLDHHAKKVFTFKYSDPDGDALDISLTSGSQAAEWKDDGAGTLTLSIDGNGAPAGSYVASVSVSDGICTTEGSVLYTLLPNNQPEIQQDGEMPSAIKYKETASVLMLCCDADKDELTATLDPGSAAAEWTSEGSGAYRLTVRGDAAPAGYYTASISVDDGFGGSASHSVSYYLAGNTIPIVAGAFPDRVLTVGAAETLDLADMFRDPDGDQLTYDIISVEGPLNAQLDGSVLTLTATGPGVGEIRFSATDTYSEPIKDSFRFSAHSTGVKIAEVYPATVTSKLSVQAVSVSQMKVQIYNSTGRCVHSASIKPDPYSPYVINVSGLAPGRYTVVLSGSKGTVKYSILKI